MARKGDEYNWLDDPFDEKKAARDQARGGTGKAAAGCVAVLVAFALLMAFALAGVVGIMADR